MLAAIQGFVTVWTVIGIGWFLAQIRIGNKEHQRFLNRYTFLVANPVLLYWLMSRASLQHLFARTVIVSSLAIVVAGLAYLVFLVWRREKGIAPAIVGCLCAGYTNAGNLGLPIAAFVLGDMTWMAPILLLQVGVIQPTALAVLDALAVRREGKCLNWGSYLCLPLRNPMTIGTMLGIFVNLIGLSTPAVVAPPIEMVAATAVPCMLLAFGMSLRLDPLPGVGPHLSNLIAANVIKVFVHPLAAYFIGVAFGLSLQELLVVTVLGALPTAQNIYIVASRYQVQVQLARDSIFWSTLLTIPTIIAISSILR